MILWRSWLISALAFIAATRGANELQFSPRNLSEVTFRQNIGARLSLDMQFDDDSGERVQLKDCLGKGPTIITMGYYECPMLCSLVLNGLVHTLQEIKPNSSFEPNVVFVSVDPKEDPDLAAAKKKTYVKRFGRTDANERWHFLTGSRENIAKLAEEIGFSYRYDPVNKQYAHPSGIVVLTPDGKISKYFFGVSYSAAEVSAALKQAQQGASGEPIPSFLMLCSKFMTLTGKHSAAVMLAVRALAIASIVGIAGLVIASARRRKRGPA